MITTVAVSNCIFKRRPKSVTLILLKGFEARMITVVKTRQF